MPRGRRGVVRGAGRGAGRAAGRGRGRVNGGQAVRQPEQENRPNTRGQKRNADELEPEVPELQAEGPQADIDGGGNVLLQEDADIWVLGDSIPYWAGERAKQTGKEHLSLPNTTIAWWAVRGLGWSTFRHSIETQVLLCNPPRIIAINLGGNDLVSLSLLNVKTEIEAEIAYLRDAFPGALIIWIDILPRRVWRGASGLKAIDDKRKRVNRVGRQTVRKSGRSDVISPDIDAETNFFRNDGIHLNEVGCEFYLDYLKDAIIRNL
ncbi:uncharacterized protein LOC128548800 [Mercenaria mercenaria]|uniref:uncharacterized protein LOC128548800 n=1 Tax=Mercenaria mercenaria TaxID=6596 RepID=UPI00234FAD92|nr:uncharacterized protein LOC128548800 [Mercenaria mercenaria]